MTTDSIPSPRPGSFAVVTGASSGIGEALALELGRRGHDLLLVARTTAPMQAIADQLPERDVRIRSVDLSDAHARAELIDELSTLPVHIIINSAGIATFGDFVDLDYGYERAQFELNATALYELTAAILPGMIGRRDGGIVNVGSAAGNMAIPGNATYVGTKAMVNTYTESLHYELKKHGVKCTLLAPGPVREARKEEEKRSGVDRVTPDFVWTTYEDCAVETLDALAANKLRVVPGPLSKIMNTLSTYVPRKLSAPVMARLYAKMAEEVRKEEAAKARKAK
ncbi:Corynebacterineae mycolate reductase A [Corynebacterium resistens DSM 45100]|uniref:Corynebacterineae mycolate reductase A n=1 Tax=Corynebacterium resistens (strain DSM 45100 / JCM 12819 / GTC 2026 / SICGH 158) TaxID=662755 RepID=F8DZ30_CORRG|nr:mycolate reductase [Corynebacterium resistens]AEI08971.1 Corynebacterineae mycolate reductase A [Corynebacterium resistens DSM 45100]